MITASTCKAILPSIKSEDATKFADAFNLYCSDYEITTPLRIAHFLAQIGHESHFRARSENLSYSAKRLRQVFRKYFKTDEAAKPFHRQPKKIANRVYGGRMGNKGPSDGWNYRGRGYIQITGKNNYKLYGKKTGLDLVETPALAVRPDVAMRVAMAYWQTRGCNALADQDKVKSITKKINGGYNGLKDREHLLGRAKKAVGESQAPSRKIGSELEAEIAAAVETKNELLKQGVKSENVRQMQLRLKRCDYRVGAADGHFGTNTRNALLAFQSDHNLSVDGMAKVGGETWQALAEAAASGVKAPQSEARQEAKSSDLGKTSRIVKDGNKANGIGQTSIVAVLAGGGLESADIGWFEQTKVYLGDMVAGVDPALLAGGLGLSVAVNGVFWMITNRMRQSRIDDHKRGKTL